MGKMEGGWKDEQQGEGWVFWEICTVRGTVGMGEAWRRIETCCVSSGSWRVRPAQSGKFVFYAMSHFYKEKV